MQRPRFAEPALGRLFIVHDDEVDSWQLTAGRSFFWLL
jgi:hypothetical protein